MRTKLLSAFMLIILAVAPLWAKGPNGSSALYGLTDDEKANILYLYEEEKLAFDMYTAMYSYYGAYVFDNIRESEQRHMDAVAKLIVTYGLDNTVLLNDPGVFANETIQYEYELLLEEGRNSLTSALQVGVEIELMDIGDIERMLTQTEKRDIKQVLSNLLDGSYNHLDAFNNQLGAIP